MKEYNKYLDYTLTKEDRLLDRIDRQLNNLDLFNDLTNRLNY